MIDLHERLSEYSYGYGVTRETEILLEGIGIQAVPFLPNLIQENDLGFDVAFNRPGAVLMLQFKLGHSLRTFRRTDLSAPPPELDRPYWRFSINTAEPEGQFETLYKAEELGAETYYVAPRFSDWPHYADLFEKRHVLDNSLLIRPSDIRHALLAKGDPDGPHRIVYDRRRVHVCSTPSEIRGMEGREAVTRVAGIARERKESTERLLERIFVGLDERWTVRRESGTELPRSATGIENRATGEYARLQRRRRFDALARRAKSKAQAVAAAVGTELWTLGIQLVLAVEKD